MVEKLNCLIVVIVVKARLIKVATVISSKRKTSYEDDGGIAGFYLPSRGQKRACLNAH